MRVVSLFSGAGFLDLGFSENGYDVTWGAEIEREFARAHNYNLRLRYGHTEDKVRNVSVTEIGADEIPFENCRGIIGGPPCQDFSKGNANNPGVEGERGRLVWDFLEKVSHLRPDFFLFENVAGLYTTKTHRENALFPMLNIFSDMGQVYPWAEGLRYKTYFEVLNSLDYGIPQDRQRVFIVGFKENIVNTLRENNMPEFEWPIRLTPNAKRQFNWPEPWGFGTEVDEEEFINNLEVPYGLTVHSVIGNQEELRELPNHVYFNPYSQRFHTVAEGDTARKSFKRLHRFKYSPTVAYGNNEVHLHPTEPRRLSVREALRLQSVPDWYSFPDDMALDKMFKMISNGVPYRLANLLARQIQIVMNNYDNVIQNQQVTPQAVAVE
ncbi:DNA cytosine methyltransferase [Bacillus sp. 165]|uniref:DNA cytosine methyltransferase n=1 Tax=Bacillus sp. 165 TaxID=1529117 RepID=UPI001ADBDB2A|nr:DNA cytosine methyltransferase [Bacillus sp. 165]MBO9131433.1 DNA cytosine methyltransferase [Bacillus sp. 165]